MKAIDNKELILAIEQLCKEQGYKKEYLLEAINQALVTAYKKNYDALENVKVNINDKTGETHLYAVKEIMEDPLDEATEISLEDARKIRPDANIGETVDIEIIPKDFGRIAAVAAKNVIIQKLREAERKILYDEFANRKGDIVTGYIQKVEPGKLVVMDLGKLEGIMLKKGMIETETYRVNDKIRAYVEDVEETAKGNPQVRVSRSSPNFVRKLLELEIPEIYEGLIEIKAIAREPGNRTKIAVYSPDENIDPVGSCVGQKGVRIQNIIDELHGEKIDIIEYNEDASIYLQSALSPAEILAIDLDPKKHFAQIIVPDNQLSLAIGKNGKNVKLAVNLTGWKIDIKTESAFRKILEERAMQEEQQSEEKTNEAEKEMSQQDLDDIKELMGNEDLVKKD